MICELSVERCRSKDARKYLERYNKRVDLAIDAFYNDPNSLRPSHSSGPSTSKLNQLFDTYKGIVNVFAISGTGLANGLTPRTTNSRP